MAGCKSCQRGGNNGDGIMNSSPVLESSPQDVPSMEGYEGSLPMPEGMGSEAGAGMEAPPVAMSGGMSCGKKHKKGGNLTTHAVPVLLTLAATRKGKSMKNRLSLGVLKGGKKSKKVKGKKSKKVKKSKKAKKSKKTRKSRR